jgi:hypothetical protein
MPTQSNYRSTFRRVDAAPRLKGLVWDAMKVADENKSAELEGLISALGIMSWKSGDPRVD